MGPYNNSNNTDDKKVARMSAIRTNPQGPLLADCSRGTFKPVPSRLHGAVL